MAIVSCPICRGQSELELNTMLTAVRCQYCEELIPVPKPAPSEEEMLLQRADMAFDLCEFDRAEELYLQLIEKSEDAYVYWRLFLCHYGITYAEDYDGRYVPTINRTREQEPEDNHYYQKSLLFASPEQKALFENDGKIITGILRKTLEIARAEAPYDVFISYKDKDENDRPTKDRGIGSEIYDALTEAGYRVFFSHVTLNDKGGEDYEPYIFAALSSARIMILVGTRADYLKSPWVKNEWKRYLNRMRAEENKYLLPAYKGFLEKDLPEEIEHKEGVSLNQPDYLQQIIRNVSEKIGSIEQFEKLEREAEDWDARYNNLLELALWHMERGKWDKADELIKQVLAKQKKNPIANLYALLWTEKCKNLQEYESKIIYPPVKKKEYQNAVMHCKGEEADRIKNHCERMEKRINTAYSVVKNDEFGCYKRALELVDGMQGQNHQLDKSIDEWKKQKQIQQDYLSAVDIVDDIIRFPHHASEQNLARAKNLFDKTKDRYSDSDDKSKYLIALGEVNLSQEKWDEAQACFDDAVDFAVSTDVRRHASRRCDECTAIIKEIKTKKFLKVGGKVALILLIVIAVVVWAFTNTADFLKVLAAIGQLILFVILCFVGWIVFTSNS